MFLRSKTKDSNNHSKETETKIEYKDKIEKIREKLAQADVVILGAGAGLSTSAGFVYNGMRFQHYFGDFAEKYGFSDMYSGGFHPYKTLEEHWAYWSRYIYVNRFMDAPEGRAVRMQIPSDLVPKCPRCGRPMSMNLRADIPPEIRDKAIGVDADIAEVIGDIKKMV